MSLALNDLLHHCDHENRTSDGNFAGLAGGGYLYFCHVTAVDTAAGIDGALITLYDNTSAGGATVGFWMHSTAAAQAVAQTLINFPTPVRLFDGLYVTVGGSPTTQHIVVGYRGI